MNFVVQILVNIQIKLYNKSNISNGLLLNRSGKFGHVFNKRLGREGHSYLLAENMCLFNTA